jgi:hypothetical protein
MKIITIISPDKLSMSMFCDFYKSLYVGEYPLEILDLNCIFSKEVLNTKFNGFIDLHKKIDNIIVKYKIKSKSIISLPADIERCSNYIIKFDIFSTYPEILKDYDGQGKLIAERWNTNITNMNGGSRQ